MKNSCINCKYRKIGCHNKCDSYKKYKEEIERINKNRKTFNEQMRITLNSYKRIYI